MKADKASKPAKPVLGPRTAARLGAVQALYQMDVVQAPVADVLAEFGSWRLGDDFEAGQCGPADFAFLRDIVTGVLREQLTIDPLINDALAEGWSLNRLDSILRAILRAGTFELAFRPDVPFKVIINEYVQVAGAFFADDEYRFVNGALDRLARVVRAADFK
jgi:N utilization substance protein B